MIKPDTLFAVALFLLMLLLLPQSQATIYKTTDKKGEVTFSDTQSKNGKAEKVTIEPINTINMSIPEPPPQEEEPESTEINYKSLVITEPANETTFRSISTITVKAKATPSLQEKHKMKLLFDGKAIGKAQTSTQFLLEDVYRGEHRITVQIVNGAGKVLIETNSTIYVFRPVIPKNRTNEPRPIPGPQ